MFCDFREGLGIVWVSPGYYVIFCSFWIAWRDRTWCDASRIDSSLIADIDLLFRAYFVLFLEENRKSFSTILSTGRPHIILPSIFFSNIKLGEEKWKENKIFTATSEEFFLMYCVLVHTVQHTGGKIYTSTL